MSPSITYLILAPVFGPALFFYVNEIIHIIFGITPWSHVLIASAQKISVSYRTRPGMADLHFFWHAEQGCT
jgi:hypothetical protein